MGRMVPDYGEPDFREIVLDNYRIFYLITDGDVLVMAIEDSKRNILRALGPDPWSIT
jgi:plasmid stabilization system protein ParE